MHALTRVSRPIVLLGLLLLSGGAIVGQQGSAPQRASKLKTLLAQRLDLLRQIAVRVKAQQAQGMAGSADVQRAAIAVIRADLDMDHSRAERIALRQRWVEAARAIEKAAEVAVKEGAATHESVILTRIARVEAQIGLEREQLNPPSRR